MKKFNYKKHINAFEDFESDVQDIEEEYNEYERACEDRMETEREER